MPFDPSPQRDLFAEPGRDDVLSEGAVRLDGFALALEGELLAALSSVAESAPFRHMTTPTGWRMSVAMTNCGDLGWVTDREGYRYVPNDPTTGLRWPAMPRILVDLASRAADRAGFPDFRPDACLVNRYTPGAKLSLHQDRNEEALDQPIVSVSLGLDATFLWGGQTRTARPRRVSLASGDVVVWGGPARMTYHGIDTLRSGHHPLAGPFRYNITFRRAR